MEEYINKNALIEEIDGRIESYRRRKTKIDSNYYDGLIFSLEDIKDLVKSLKIGSNKNLGEYIKKNDCSICRNCGEIIQTIL